MPGCLFCAIAAGDIPSANLYEDGRVAAFLDIKPLAEGHALEDMASEDRHALMDAAARLTPVLCRETGVKDATLAINNGPEAGQEVGHVHLHIVPRRKDDQAGPIHALFERRPNVSSEQMHDLAVRVQAALQAGGRTKTTAGGKK
jgi:histidine triad (HIT) family protein